MLEETTDKTFGDVPADKNAMAVLGLAGDTKSFWDPRQPGEVEAARKQFEFLTREKRYSAFKMSRDGERDGDQIREFDPNAARILFVPPMQGG